MSFNHALPVQFSCPPNERSAYARELLDHPLANLHDSRLVVSVELLECRGRCLQNRVDEFEPDTLLQKPLSGPTSLW